ncbi:MAG: outer membrane lipid asymmetry maintenance protein MlaD [Legionellales bacterium]|nr:outer membrane lipid asymmetry maintenance protein MlaD [Legionellales bacterium]
MVGHRLLDLVVGFFVLIAMFALFFLAFEASSIHDGSSSNRYLVSADFDDTGSLMIKAPVRVAGVKIGEVVAVNLDRQTFKAKVSFAIDKVNDNLPKDSSVSIMTEGLLGSKYISLSPGFADQSLKNGDVIEVTHSAIILEDLIGKFLFKS